MKKIIFTENAPAPIGPYNQAVLKGNTLYTSGQIAINPTTGELVTGTIEAETEQVMQNMRAVLQAAGKLGRGGRCLARWGGAGWHASLQLPRPAGR